MDTKLEHNLNDTWYEKWSACMHLKSKDTWHQIIWKLEGY